MPTAMINGNEVYYREAGEGPSAPAGAGLRTGFPVLLVHGFTGNSRNWALTVPALAERFRTVSVDLRGHGHSHKPTERDDYTPEALSEEVYGLVRHLGIEECYLVGHSMGGMVAQHLALEHPQAVRALVLVDTAAELPDTPAFRARWAGRERLIEIARKQGMDAVFEEQLRLSPPPPQVTNNPNFLRTWKEQFVLTSPEAYIHCAHGMRSRRPLIGELPRIKVPTLIVCGESDEPFVEPSRHMHEAIAGSRLEIIAGSGHSPQIEKPAEFNRLLLGFLSGVHEAATARG